MSRIGIVTGLQMEACLVRPGRRVAGDRSLLVACDGPGPRRAYEAARRLVEAGADGLVSFGLAGGLDPELAPGTAILPVAILDEDGSRFDCAEDWRRDLTAQAPRDPALQCVDVLATLSEPVASVEAKAALRARTGASAADMESAAVARAAMEAGLPFLAIRAISDRAGDTIPRAALKGMRADGHAAALPVLVHLAAHPGELGALIRLARQTGRAKRALAALAHRLG
ncbi:purine phosphorylase [Kaustia mangrovi]|uniref:Purine phosphorylase n=1 Tax=Kaustia mangrovi TaxID=2593653 RepID=A0A7S8HDA3_9HYPH|nr:phosphorylase [Kaustia mangrovi]QPC44415.1 purine phosphorylase [Kaustia mangrovi]